MPRTTQQDDQLEQLTKMLDLPLMKAALANGLERERQDTEKQRREAIAQLDQVEADLNAALVPIAEDIAKAKSDIARINNELKTVQGRLLGAEAKQRATRARAAHVRNKLRFFLNATAPEAISKWDKELDELIDDLEKSVPSQRSEESNSFFQGRPVMRHYSNGPSRIRQIKTLRTLKFNEHRVACSCATETEALAYIETLRRTIPSIEMEPVQ